MNEKENLGANAAAGQQVSSGAEWDAASGTLDEARSQLEALIADLLQQWPRAAHRRHRREAKRLIDALITTTEPTQRAANRLLRERLAEYEQTCHWTELGWFHRSHGITPDSPCDCGHYPEQDRAISAAFKAGWARGSDSFGNSGSDTIDALAIHQRDEALKTYQVGCASVPVSEASASLPSAAPEAPSLAEKMGVDRLHGRHGGER